MPEDLELELALTDHKRGFAAIGTAFLEAATAGPEDRAAAVRCLERALVSREMQIDRLVLDVALIAFVGLMAGKTGETPRTLLESYFASAPTDGDWRSLQAWHRQRRERGET